MYIYICVHSYILRTYLYHIFACYRQVVAIPASLTYSDPSPATNIKSLSLGEAKHPSYLFIDSLPFNRPILFTITKEYHYR